MLFDIINTYDQATITHLKSIWDAILIDLVKHEDSKKIVSFLGKCCVLWIDEQKHHIHIWIPNDFIAQQVQKFFKKPLHSAIKETFDTHYSPNFVVYPELQSWSHQLQSDLKKTVPTKEKETPEMILSQPSVKKELTNHFWILFDPQYTFERFVVWAHNELAYSAAQAIAQKPGEVYNPFFIYWNVGLWKTHLMQAIWNYVIENDPDKVVLYLPTSTFIDKVIDAVRKWNLWQLQTRLKEVDVLMLDDIQFLAWKERTQEIFHNIFNEFYSEKKQIILSSDRSPKELTLLESRLQSRFALWLVADIKTPDTETRMAILQAKLKEKDIQLEPEHIELIAQTVNSNIRELEWALNIIVTRVTLLKKEITNNDIVEALSTLGYWSVQTQQSSRSWWSVWWATPNRYDSAVTFVANYFGLLVSDIRWPKRNKEISRARQLLMYIAKKHFERSLQKIWDYFGWKNHASVIYSIGTCEELLKNELVIKTAYAACKKEVL